MLLVIAEFSPACHTTCADHRSKVNYDLNKVMEGGIEESIQSLILLDQQEMLKELMEQ
jgi:peptide chain release factor 1